MLVVLPAVVGELLEDDGGVLAHLLQGEQPERSDVIVVYPHDSAQPLSPRS